MRCISCHTVSLVLTVWILSCIAQYFIRLQHMNAVHRCGLLFQMSHVAWSLCLSVRWHTCELCKNGRLRGWLMWAQGTMYYMGSRFPNGKGLFWGTLISSGSICRCSVCSKKDHSVLNNGMTARLLQTTAMLPTGRCDITLSSMKNPPPCNAPFYLNSLTTCFLLRMKLYSLHTYRFMVIPVTSVFIVMVLWPEQNQVTSVKYCLMSDSLVG